MHAMESLIKLFNKWEIQLLVLLSFTLQLFLFFAGSLRRHSSSGFLRFSNWIAYLGADFVALYALGLLSRQDQDERRETKTLGFFWAPFLLIHLGGQDTITAFSMEDNNLWLRNLLKLVGQVVLALHVFWKSIGRLHNLEFLVSGVLVFVAGIIKYGERIWSLKYSSSVRTVGRKTIDHHMTRWLNVEESGGGGYCGIVHDALQFLPYVRDIFASRPIKIVRGRYFLRQRTPEYRSKIHKMIRFELGVMYDDLYTKAIVLRARSGIILRCISQICALVAFMLFLVSQDALSSSNSSSSYSKVDIAITYSLFIGGFFLEFCTIVIFMMSPWTWVWLKARQWHRLARLSWFILTSNIGWPEEKQRWPHSLGQYNFWSISTDNDQEKTCSERVMKGVINFFVNLVGRTNENRFWMSQLLDTKYVGVDKKMIECVAEEIMVLHLEFQGESHRPREWHHLDGLLNSQKKVLVADFGQAIINMHLTTGLLLSKYPDPNSANNNSTSSRATAGSAATTSAQDDDDDDVSSSNCSIMVEVCRKLSNYMMHLLVSKPSMLPLTVSAAATLEDYHPRELQSLLNRCANLPGPSKEALEEMVCMWTRLLVYAAGKSAVEFHVAELSRGGELITFAWLLMAYCGLGDSMRRNISIINAEGGPGVEELTYAFHVPTSRPPSAASAATSLLSEIIRTPFARHG